jgi:8-oxo-dGTP diphosphatase
MQVDLEVQLCALTVVQGQLSVIVQRNDAAGVGGWRLLSGPLSPNVSIDDVARNLARATGSTATVVEQLKTYAAVSCDAGGAVRVAYFCLFPTVEAMLRRSEQFRIFAVEDLLGEDLLGEAVMSDDVLNSADSTGSAGWIGRSFVDAEVLRDAIERVRAKLEYTTIATSLVPEPFTIPELRRVYEAVWGVTLHPANFRRKVLATEGFVLPALDSDTRSGQDHLAGPDVFRRGIATVLHPAMLRT